jgi:hypothetical protein
MKIKELLSEGRSGLVGVEYEWEDPSNEFEPHFITITCHVTETTDCYGTGDSPDCYDVDVEEAVFKENGQPFNMKMLDKKAIAWIENQAIEKFNR